MFLCCTNPKFCRSEQAVVRNLYKITEAKIQKFKVLHDLKEF